MINKTQINKLLVEERKKTRQKHKQSEFMRRTLNIYKGQEARLIENAQIIDDPRHYGKVIINGVLYEEIEKPKLKVVPKMMFTLEEFRAWLQPYINTKCDCGKTLTIKALAIDHETPVSRGGGWGLDNLKAICKSCNYRKGKFLPDEFKKLVKFANEELSPESREDLWRRLTSGGKMMFGRS